MARLQHSARSLDVVIPVRLVYLHIPCRDES